MLFLDVTLFLRRKIHRRRSVIRQIDHPPPEKTMALHIYFGILSDRKSILRNSLGGFSKCSLLPTGTQILPTRTSSTRRMQQKHLGCPEVMTMWRPHASHLNNKERLREGTLRGRVSAKPRAAELACGIFFSLWCSQSNDRVPVTPACPCVVGHSQGRALRQ